VIWYHPGLAAMHWMLLGCRIVFTENLSIRAWFGRRWRHPRGFAPAQKRTVGLKMNIWHLNNQVSVKIRCTNSHSTSGNPTPLNFPHLCQLRLFPKAQKYAQAKGNTQP